MVHTDLGPGLDRSPSAEYHQLTTDGMELLGALGLLGRLPPQEHIVLDASPFNSAITNPAADHTPFNSAI